MYNELDKEGILLRDFLEQQIEAFREKYPEPVDSGLLIDIVALHTTPLGTADQKTSVVSFIVEGTHPFDVGTLLDKQGIAVRTGHHCTQPLMDIFKIPGTVRASFAFYNTKEEIDVFIKALQRSVNMLL